VTIALSVSVSSLTAQQSHESHGAPDPSAPVLGVIDFPTSASAESHEAFVRGVLLMHNFHYPLAAKSFREAQRLDSTAVMGYWGEAMTYNHPLWSEQDIAAARLVVAKFKDTPKLTERERAYVNAVKLLYGDGDKRARDAAYSAVMEKIYTRYPDDLDAAAFYSLSLLGLVNPQEKGYRLQARAGAIALEVYQKNPNHPGAAHYIIHAFDDPEHAILALPAARRYASIAPKRITRDTCRRTSFCNWECGLRPRLRTRRRGSRLRPG